MRHALLSALVAIGSMLHVAAQISTTITSDPRDLSRPISTLIDQMRQREKISITYEDPRYSNAADIEDVTADVSKGSDTEKTYGPRILVPKGHAITFVYAPTDVGSPEATKATIERMLREYSSLGGPAFVVERDGVRLHVLPSEVLNINDRLKQDSILDTVISVPPARRDGGELLEAICRQIQDHTGYKIGVGPSAPANSLAQYRTNEGIESQSGRVALEHLLDTATFPGSFVWDLYFGADVKTYMLNFSYVESAGPAVK
jgi:hypothetical protein